MLVLTRRIGEEIVIDGNIRIKILVSKGDRVRLGITAPDTVRVDREEVHARRSDFSSDNASIVDRIARSPGTHRQIQRKIIAASSFPGLEHLPAMHGPVQ